MKIFITGGTGFIGTRACQILCAAGHHCIAYDRLPATTDTPAACIAGDVRDRQKLMESTRNVDAILHLAAAHHDFGIAPQTFTEVNVTGTKNICDAATENAIHQICFFSTVAVYGTATAPLDESVRPMPESDYGKTKLQAESVCRQWTESNASNQCLVIRPTVVFGPENFANMYTLIRQVDSGKFVRVGKMDNIKSLAFVDNLVNASLELWLERSSKREKFDIYNYVDIPDLTSYQIVETIYQGLGRKSSTLSIPYGLARLLAVPFDVVISLTGKNLPISSSRIRKLAKTNTQFEAGKIHQALGKKSVPLETAILKMVDWYKNAGKSMDAPNRRPPPL